MVTTNHTAFQIKQFLESVVFNGRKLFGSRLSNPKIILLDFSLAIISASVQAFNRMTITQYLNHCYDYLKNSQPDLPQTLVFVCSAYILNRCKNTLKSSPGYKKSYDLILQIMEKAITMTDINDLKDLAQDVKIALMSATISEDLNRGVARLEKRLMNKSVHAYDDELGVDGDNNEDNTGDSNYKLDEEVEIGQSVGISYWKKEMDKVKIQDKNDESRATNNKYYKGKPFD